MEILQRNIELINKHIMCLKISPLGQIVFVSEGFLNFTGYLENELLDQHISSIKEISAETYIDLDNENIINHEDILEDTSIFKKKDGTVITVLNKVEKIFEDEKLKGYLFQIEDISELNILRESKRNLKRFFIKEKSKNFREILSLKKEIERLEEELKKYKDILNLTSNENEFLKQKIYDMQNKVRYVQKHNA